jgi:hypothetical protein
MPRSTAVAIENNFRNGLITEASGLNFPESACTETFDCIFNIPGNVTRRKGFDFEINYSTKTADRTQSVVKSYLWKNVAGSGTNILLVVQVGSTLFFYDASSTDPISANPISDTIDLNDFLASGAPTPSTVECEFADGKGLLFVTHPYTEAFSIAYDPSTSTFTNTQIDLTIRDLKGVADNLDIDNRPTSGLSGLSQTHYYNLLNQGWNLTNLTTWDAARTDMPSNCDIMWSFKNASDVFDTATIDKLYRGNSPAPKGHYILNVFNKDRSTASGLTITAETTGYNRCSVVSFYAGRVFYSGLNSTGLNGDIYFSPIIERDAQYGQCYQQNDPSSENTFDLLPSDGGVISIHEAGNIIKLMSLSIGLLVFATNGVWLVSGSTGIGFTANDYSVSKISNVRTLTASSFVEVNGSVSWWTLEGIYTLASQPGTPVVQSLTEGRVKTFYQAIPPSAKRRATGVFNSITGIIQWLYRTEDSGDLETLYEATNVLNYNVNTQAFYPWTVSNGDVKIHAAVIVENLGGNISIENVVDNSGTLVVDNDGNQVVVYNINDGIVTPKFKYIVSYANSGSYKFTIAEERDTDYVDWASYSTGMDYESYFITGYKVHGQGVKNFQSNYVNVYSKNTEPTSYFFQGLWDFANSGNTGRWSSRQIVEHTDVAYDYLRRRLKVRGSGKALQFKVNSFTGSPFNIAGWAVYETGNSSV